MSSVLTTSSKTLYAIPFRDKTRAAILEFHYDGSGPYCLAVFNMEDDQVTYAPFRISWTEYCELMSSQTQKQGLRWLCDAREEFERCGLF